MYVGKEGGECMQKGMEENRMKMYKIRITAVRQTVYHDLMAQYENPIEHTCCEARTTMGFD